MKHEEEQNELQRSLLELLAETSYRPVKPRKIAKQLHLGEEQLKELKQIIKRLVKEGRLAYGQNHAVGLPSGVDSNRVTGSFRRMADGYGFVRPTGTARSRERDDDIYIPAAKTR